MKQYDDERINEILSNLELEMKFEEEYDYRDIDNDIKELCNNVDKVVNYVNNEKQGKLYLNSNIWEICYQALSEILKLYDLQFIGSDKTTEREEVVKLKDYNDVNINPDIEMGKIFKIKDYICQIDDYNQENPNESIIFIYESQEDLDNGEYLEQISLLNKNIKDNLEEYISNNYYKEVDESERAYFAFVLGYDLLNNVLKKSNIPECDLSYDFCNRMATKFLNSKEYKNVNYSGYEMLCEWIDKNRFFIKQELLPNCPIKSRNLKNGVYVIDFGYKKDDLIVLIERTTKEEKKYLIGFNCRVDNNELKCDYKIYYPDKLHALNSFNTILTNGKLKKCIKER